MVKPVSYLQTDSRWANQNYSAKGETKTIKSSGCGPTCAAMVIATLKDKNITPSTTADWAMANGYKALNQGTYYTYFVPQFNQYGIEGKRLNTSNLYGKSSSTAHTEALNALRNSDWVIACMGVGNWTSGGHFILVYEYENGYVYINDPASINPARLKNTWDLFSGQIKYLWTVRVPDSFKTSGSLGKSVDTTRDSAMATSGASSVEPSEISSLDSSAETIYKSFVGGVQAACGAKVDKIAGNETLSKTVTVSKTKNQRHPVVKVLQVYLNALGYDCGKADGIAGVKFDAAVKAYQKDNKCVVDGEITAKNTTWKKLLKLA